MHVYFLFFFEAEKSIQLKFIEENSETNLKEVFSIAK
jgi:hypothetical protein